VDNINGPTGLIAACGKGVLRTLLCHRNKIADLVPLDFPVNLIISAAWNVATERFVKIFLVYYLNKLKQCVFVVFVCLNNLFVMIGQRIYRFTTVAREQIILCYGGI